MQTFMTAYAGKILEFLITTGAIVTAAAPALHVSQEMCAVITVGCAILKNAESVFVTAQDRAGAIATLKAP